MRVVLIALFIVLVDVRFVAAQDSSQACASLLSTFERLGPARFDEIDGNRWLVYEDRVSRQPLRNASKMMAELSAGPSTCQFSGVVPYRNGMRLGPVSTTGKAFERPLGLGRPPSRGMHVDLEIELLYNFAIDYQPDWFRDRIAIGPKLKLWWPSGLMIAGQYAIPVRNQLPELHAEYWSKPYPNVLMAGFRKQFSPNWIGAVSAGFYERNRYGGDFQLYWMSERWPIVLGGRAGMTGYWSFDDGKLNTGPVNFFNGYLDGTVYLPWYNLRVRGKMGQFVREINQVRRPGQDVKRNPGTSGEITRMFGEIEIGFHAFYDGFVVFPGFRFAAPLSPNKGLKKGRVAVYPTRQLYVPYDLGRVQPGNTTGFVRPKRGELHRTDLDIWSDLRVLTPYILGHRD